MGTRPQNGDGLSPKIIKFYSKNAKLKKTLFTKDDLIKIFDITKKAGNNVLYNLHRERKICRHKERVGSGGRGRGAQYQYAIEIEEQFNDPYETSFSRTTTPSTGGAHGLSAIQKMFVTIQNNFAATQNNMARLEDMILEEVAQAEIIKKQKSKIAALQRNMVKLMEEG